MAGQNMYGQPSVFAGVYHIHPHRSAWLKRQRTAFTLVELLVVLGIIVLLLGLLFPIVHGVRDRSNRAVCASNLRTVGQLIRLYADDNRGEIPAVYAPLNDVGPLPGNYTLITAYRSVQNGRPTAAFSSHVYLDKGGIALLVAPPVGAAKQSYTKSAKVFFCPADDLNTAARKSPDSFGWQPNWGPQAEYHLLHAGVMSYMYIYVPPGGDRFDFLPFAPENPHWEKKLLAGLERHSISQRTAASTAVMADGSLFFNYQWHRRPAGGAVLYLDGHVTWLNRGDVFVPEVRGRFNLRAILTALDKGRR